MVNRATAEQQSLILKSEAQRQQIVLTAQGEADATRLKARATADALTALARSINQNKGREALSLQVAEQYIKAFSQLAQKSTSILLPNNPSDVGSMVAQALTVFDSLSRNRSKYQENGSSENDQQQQQSPKEFFESEDDKNIEPNVQPSQEELQWFDQLDKTEDDASTSAQEEQFRTHPPPVAPPPKND